MSRRVASIAHTFRAYAALGLVESLHVGHLASFSADAEALLLLREAETTALCVRVASFCFTDIQSLADWHVLTASLDAAYVVELAASRRLPYLLRVEGTELMECMSHPSPVNCTSM